MNTEKIILLKPVESENHYMAALDQFTSQSHALTECLKTYQLRMYLLLQAIYATPLRI
ncbi:hypothetical protein [Lentibacillus sp. CBA3610]|uniref:hypothetical protein n=1 Tax=Lentibacillus sp. CBA3610 TaxID=2518176 RepID=UPI00159635C7|nr:hypothetical protein [Lentibacillus sp. CBA3610]